MMNTAYRVGTAGWSLPKRHAAEFPMQGTHLGRYAQRFSAVEVNSSFYRPHKPATYARWAAGVPADFRFAVKVPREITHVRKLVAATAPLERFLSEVRALESALGPLLVQLPPSLRFDDRLVETFLGTLRDRYDGAIVCEPRHPTWFTSKAGALLTRFRIACVAADPAVVPQAAEPGGWAGIAYRRLHGSPQTYYSSYSSEYLAAAARAIQAGGAAAPEQWCIFDNTALGEATANALELQRRLRLQPTT